MNKQKLISIIRQREALVDEIPSDYIKALERIQNDLYKDIFDYLDQRLKRSGANIGAIGNLSANMQTALALRDQIRKFLRHRGYYEATGNFSKKYKELTDLSRDYYKALDLDPTFTRRDLKTLALLRDTDTNFLMLNDQRVINITYTTLTDSIARNITWRKLADELKTLHTDTVLPNGKKLNGLLKYYNATYANNAFAGFDRKIQMLKSEQLGMNKYLYSGGLLKDSRKFCVDRAGKVFTREQVLSWQKLSWRGKVEGRDIFTALGGHNCQHILSPITDELAAALPELFTA